MTSRKKSRVSLERALTLRNDVASQSAYTFVELLVALVIAAGVITVAVMAYSAVGASKSDFLAYTDVTLPSGAIEGFYGTSGSVVTAHAAPNFGRSALAELLKDKLYEDLADASAVFCLSRSVSSSTRPGTIPVNPNIDFIQISTPEAFRQLLATAIPSSAGTFSAYQNGVAEGPNSSLFILSRSPSSTELRVKAIYECDIIDAESPSGSYVTVRRYQSSGTDAVCTHFYDVFYPGSPADSFTPVAAFFERSVRYDVTATATTADLLKRAENQPFYFWWWPDPAVKSLESDVPDVTTPSETRDLYQTMNGRTAYFLVIPAYPALW